MPPNPPKKRSRGGFWTRGCLFVHESTPRRVLPLLKTHDLPDAVDLECVGVGGADNGGVLVA